ncbi:hypothetical protein Pelo_4661 [Pelomyxa schiedti]|nr:hypothetical protein Pelo_4661 [Pelomyxa schiedti]
MSTINQHLIMPQTGSSVTFAVLGCLDLAVGFLMAMRDNYERDGDWYLVWYCWCLMQVIYMVLSTIYLVNVLRLLCNMSHDTTVPVPKCLIFVYTAILVLLTVVGIIADHLHIMPFCGILTFLVAASIAAVIAFKYTGHWMPLDYD